MQRITVRTLALMVELLIAVVSYQYVHGSLGPSVQPDAMWVGGSPAAQSQTADVNRPHGS